MAWFTANNQSDELVERATDANLPADSEDIALYLEICDRIRSKAYPATAAMRCLKKRISHKNPNVQLLALNLCDLCVKNGGSHFLVEIASREFVDNLVSLLRAPGGVNIDVENKMLALIQSWALAFENRHELGNMTSTYRSLRNEGMHFPPEESISAAFVDTAVAPDWTDSDVCMRCRTAFTFTNRKHHCRNCGNVFCNTCSSMTSVLPHLGINEPVRVCTSCWDKRNRQGQPQQPNSQRPLPSSIYSKPQAKASNRPANEGEDLDLKRALELSLAESKNSEPLMNARRDSGPPDNEVEDDADLKAAIEASLREAAPAKARDTYEYPKLSTSNTAVQYGSVQPGQSDPSSVAPMINPYEIQQAEQENVRLFATLVERLKTDSHGTHGTILRDPKIQELYESISNLRPKLARSLGDTIGKYESLVETHSKLATVVKYYDRMLEARLSSTYGRDSYAAVGRPSEPYSSNMASAYYSNPPGRGYELPSALPQPQSDNVPARDYYGAQQQYTERAPNYVDQNQGSRFVPSQPPVQSEPAQPKEEISLIDL